MYRSGIRTFLEVGPDRKLTALVGSILAGREHAALAVDASRGQRGNMADLARALAQLAALGHPVRLPLWDDGADHHAIAGTTARTVRKPGLTVKVCGANPGPTPTHAATTNDTHKPTTPTKSNLDASLPMTPTTPGRLPPPHNAPTNGKGNSTVPPGHGQGPNGATPEHGHPGAHTLGSPIPALRSNDPALLAMALRTAQDNLVSLQKLGEQTAQLHRQFLDGQDRTQRTFQTLLEQQQKLVLASLGMEPLAAPSLLHRGEPAPSSEFVPEPVAKRMTSPVPHIQEEAFRERSAELLPPAPTPRPQAEAIRIQAVLMAIVAEKTGYPAEMLEPTMKLDADLGIDSIKRVEILSTLQEQLPDAPVIKPEHLGVLQTLADIVGFLTAGGAQAEIQSQPRQQQATACAAVQDTLLAIVADKTGYPAEMLEPTMRLDADLGIDSIKRVEILSTLQEQLPDAPVIKPEHLGVLQTLADIVGFLTAGGAQAEVQSQPRQQQATACAAVQDTLLAIVADKTGYPAEMLEPTMRLDADLGIDSIKRVEILSALQEQLPDAPVIKPEHLGVLQTLGQIVEFLTAGGAEAGATPGPTRAGTPPQPQGQGRKEDEPVIPPQRLVLTRTFFDERRAREPVRLRPGSQVWIGSDGDDDSLALALAVRLQARGHDARVLHRAEIGSQSPPARLDGLLLLAPASGGDDATIKDAFGLLRTAGPGLRQAGRAGGAVFATVTQLDGAFGTRGLALDPRSEPISGGMAGLAKTAGHEWSEVACKAIDIEPAFARGDVERAAEAILDELLHRGPVEVGLASDGRSTLELVAEGTRRRCRDARSGRRGRDQRWRAGDHGRGRLRTGRGTAANDRPARTQLRAGIRARLARGARHCRRGRDQAGAGGPVKRPRNATVDR